MTKAQAEQYAERELLGELIQSNDMAQIEAIFASSQPVEIARMISSLARPAQIRLLEILGPEESAHLISKISDLGTENLVTQLTTPHAVSIVKEMSRDQQAHFLRTIGDDDAEAILDEIKPQKAEKIRKLMSYPENTAGGLMITEYLSFPEVMLVKEVLDDLREHGETYSDFDLQYAYVVSETGHLRGVLRLRDLLMAPRNRGLSETMIKTPLHVNINASLRDLKDFFRQYTFLGVPVTDDEGKLVGVILSSLVVGVSLAANTLLAVSFGGLVPLILRGMRTDPALASGPLLTTVTDMCGFFFVLSFASLMLPRLAG